MGNPMRNTLLGALLFFAPVLYAQVSSPSITVVASAPSGSCTNNLPDRQVATTGLLYSCQNGTWALIAGGGGGAIPGVQAEPYVAPSTASSVTPANSPLYLDAYQFSSTAPDTAINLCTIGAFCDARSYGSGSYTTSAQITVGNSSGGAQSLLLPTGGLRPSTLGSWTGGMTGGTLDTLYQYGGTSIVGTPGSGLGNQFRLRAGTSSSLNHIYETNAGGNGEDYFYACCMTVENISGTGTATASGAGSYIHGSADASVWEYMGFFDSLDTYDLELFGNCCGPTIRNSQINGNYGSTPLYISTTSGQSGGPYNLNELSIVHPGSGDSALLQSDTNLHSTLVNLNNIYTETSTTDHTTTLASFSGAKSINIHNWNFVANYSGDGAPGITIANVGTPGAHFDGLSWTNGTGDFFYPITSAIVDNYRSVTVPSDANGHIGMYDNSVDYLWGDVNTGHKADYEATIASASTIAPVNPVILVTGTNAINTITAPAGCTTSGIDCIETLIADPSTGPFTLGTGGNIYAAAAPAVGTRLTLQYRPASSLWYAGSAGAVTGAINPSSTGATTPGTGAFTTLSGTSVASGSPTTAAQSALPTGSHGFACDESATAGVPASNVDYLRCDSASHKILESLNDGSELSLLTSTGASTLMVLPFAASPTSGTSALTAANVINLGTVFSVPPQGLTISHIAVSLSTQDATGGHLYDLCIYSISGTTGTLAAHIGATAFSSQYANSFAITGAPVTLPAGNYITAWTGNANTAAMYTPWAGTNSVVISPYGEGNSNTTSGGTCGTAGSSTITLSAVSYQTTVQPGGWLLF